MQHAPDISVTCEVAEELASFVHRKLRRAATNLKGAPAAISVAIVSRPTMARLHHQFLGRRSATDVLSFEIAHDARGCVSEGEIIVCLDVARQQARRRGHPVENELLLYALHGLLHLCGYDDASPAQAVRMHAAEDQILQAIGVGPVFAPPAPRPTSSRRRPVAARRGSS